jgi:predicted transcriptional regulator
MTDLIEVVTMMAVPASVLFTIRYLNLRDERDALRESSPTGRGRPGR